MKFALSTHICGERETYLSIFKLPSNILTYPNI